MTHTQPSWIQKYQTIISYYI